MGILAAASFHPAELLGFTKLFLLYIEAVPAAVHAPLCMCMLLGVIRLIAIDWLYCGLYSFYWFLTFVVFCPTSQGEGSQTWCSRLRPETLCFHPGRPWSSQTLRCWISALKCSYTVCCGRGPSGGHRLSGPAGEAKAWFICVFLYFNLSLRHNVVLQIVCLSTGFKPAKMLKLEVKLVEIPFIFLIFWEFILWREFSTGRNQNSFYS